MSKFINKLIKFQNNIFELMGHFYIYSIFLLYFSIINNCFSQKPNILLNKNNFVEYQNNYSDIYQIWEKIYILIGDFKEKKYNERTNYQIFQSSLFEISLSNFNYIIKDSNQLKLESIEKYKNNIYMAKISSYDEYYGLIVIYNLYVTIENEQVKFIDPIDFKLSELNFHQFKNIKYYYFDEINSINVNKFNEEIKFFDIFFEFNIGEITYFKFLNNFQIQRYIGYDYEGSMFFANQNGSLAFPKDKIIFSGNNKEYNIHELIHIYTYHKFNSRNSIIDEGLATYFGGSKGLTLDEHTKALKIFLETNKTDIYQHLFFGGLVINENTSLKYTMGGVICKLILEKYGKDTLFDLLDSGNKSEDLIKKLENILNISRNEFNEYFYDYLDKI